MNNDLPKLALVGYGAMGKEIEKLALELGFTITDIFDLDNEVDRYGDIKSNRKYDFDVAIDFTYPEEVIDNAKILAKHNKNIVIGTTGWYHNRELIQSIAKESGIGILFGSNFSIGMQMFLRMTRYVSRLVNKIDGYDIMMHEIHHSRKKDSPSGTALSLANIIMEEVDSKTNILTETAKKKMSENTLHVSSTRGGDITGTHTIYLDSYADTLELTHRAKNRRGFALGALKAAQWIHNKKGFFEFNQMLNNLWGDC